MKKPIPLSTVIKIFITVTMLGILLMVIGLCIGNNVGLVVLLAGLIVIAGAIVFRIIYYRCPYCEGFLTIPYRNHYCPHCGKYLT